MLRGDLEPGGTPLAERHADREEVATRGRELVVAASPVGLGCRLDDADPFEMLEPLREHLPIGVYSLPEISFVGRTEEELTAETVPYEVGISRYRELARGQILGDEHGLVKLLVSPEDRKLLGVHALGANATEVVHLGQAVMGLGGTVDFLVESVFNYPTLAEAYKVAALDAVNKLRAVRQLAG